MATHRAQPILRASGPTLRAARAAGLVGVGLLGLGWALSWAAARWWTGLLPWWSANAAWLVIGQALPMVGGVLVAWWIFVSIQVRTRTRSGEDLDGPDPRRGRGVDGVPRADQVADD